MDLGSVDTAEHVITSRFVGIHSYCLSGDVLNLCCWEINLAVFENILIWRLNWKERLL